jgi:hypothetical protein
VALDTVTDYVAAARILLQDKSAEAYRYSDSELVLALSFAMLEARRLRPDLFIGRASAVPSFVANDATPVVLDQQYRVAVIYYIVGHAQLRDEEDTQDQRAAALLGKFQSQMLSL